MAAKPNEVTKVLVSDSTRFEHGGGTTQIRTVSYWVGVQGPFRYSVPLGEYSDDKATADMVKTVSSLRTIGALA